MSRIINRPCAVTLGPREGWRSLVPVEFVYLKERHRVAVVTDRWTEVGRWWEKEPETETWRVQTVKGGVFELVHTPSEKTWRLYKAYD